MHQKFDPAFFPEEILPTVYIKNLLPAHFTRERDISPWGLLMDAVVMQAAEDYREGCRTLRRYPKNKGAFLLKAEAVEFFRSKYFSFFTAVPGEEILRLLEKEQEEIKKQEELKKQEKLKENITSRLKR